MLQQYMCIKVVHPFVICIYKYIHIYTISKYVTELKINATYPTLYSCGMKKVYFWTKNVSNPCATWHRCRSRQISRGAKDFCANFPKLARKVFWATFAYKVSATDLFLVWIPKKVFMCFLQTLGTIFWVKQEQRWAPFLPRFSGILPRFSTDQNFWGMLAPPLPTPLLPDLHWSISPVCHILKRKLKQLFCFTHTHAQRLILKG